MPPERIQVSESGGRCEVEFFPPKAGAPVVGRGDTVLEAIGAYALNKGLVILEPSELVETRFSSINKSQPRRT